MTSLRVSHVLAGCVLTVSVGLGAPVSYAQVNPGGQLPSGQGPGEEKSEGVAEQAPKVPGALPTTPVLPPPKSKRKRFRLFELDGYFRLRGDWFKHLDGGFADVDTNPAGGGASFPNPLGCRVDAANAPDACKDTLRSTNIRLRLEPTINLDERASVHAQIDVYDNYVLGATPDGLLLDGTPAPPNIPTGAFTPNQQAPERGRNYDRDSIVIKRAWGEVITPLGLLKFGRMPSHWGMGIYANAGGANPFDGTYDLDSDYGDTVDRLMFGAGIPGTDFKFAVATDWPSTAPVSAQTGLNDLRLDGQPFDLDDNDDVYQWTFAITRLDDPELFDELIDDGETVLNYGVYFVYRSQDFDLPLDGAELGESPDLDQYVRRNAEIYIPDVWLKFGWKNLRIELEAVAMFGNIENAIDLIGEDDTLDIRAFGGVFRLTNTFFDDDLLVGLETGFASGDQWDAANQGQTHFRAKPTLPGEGDTSVNLFMFDPDYEIDLILFREMLGTVHNALYFRPMLHYDLTDRIRAKGQAVWAFAHKPVSTPGNDSMYGIEFDLDLGYHNQGFFAGLSYGVLFPLGALDHPIDLGYGENTGNAETAQTFQTRLVLSF